MLTNTKPETIINSTLATLMEELGEECETVLSLLSQLKLANLSNEQKGDILGQLSGSITHLHVHTESLPDLIGDELFNLPDGE